MSKVQLRREESTFLDCYNPFIRLCGVWRGYFMKGEFCMEKNKCKAHVTELTVEELRERLEALKDEKFILTVSLQIGDDDDDEKA